MSEFKKTVDKGVKTAYPLVDGNEYMFSCQGKHSYGMSVLTTGTNKRVSLGRMSATNDPNARYRLKLVGDNEWEIMGMSTMYPELRITVEGGSPENGVPIITALPDNSPSQRFKIEYSDVTKCYRIFTAASNYTKAFIVDRQGSNDIMVQGDYDAEITIQGVDNWSFSDLV